MELYRCSHCGNIVVFVENSGVPVVCCGEKMQKLLPNTVDASKEKHVPVVKREGNVVTVTVGAVAHPMEEKHYIEWIALETKSGRQRKQLAPGASPVAQFALCEGDEVVAAYAYCNLHGFWKA